MWKAVLFLLIIIKCSLWKAVAVSGEFSHRLRYGAGLHCIISQYGSTVANYIQL